MANDDGNFPLFQIKGRGGDNETYTRIGNLATIENDPEYGYIALFIAEDNNVVDANINAPRNLAIVRASSADYSIDPSLPDTLDVTSVSESYSNKLRWLTNYTEEENLHATRPKLVALGEDKYMALWEEWQVGGNGDTFNGVFGMVIDANGDTLDEATELTDSHHLHQGDDAFSLDGKAGWMTGSSSKELYLHLVDESLEYTMFTLD